MATCTLPGVVRSVAGTVMSISVGLTTVARRVVPLVVTVSPEAKPLPEILRATSVLPARTVEGVRAPTLNCGAAAAAVVRVERRKYMRSSLVRARPLVPQRKSWPGAGDAPSFIRIVPRSF